MGFQRGSLRPHPGQRHQHGRQTDCALNVSHIIHPIHAKNMIPKKHSKAEESHQASAMLEANPNATDVEILQLLLGFQGMPSSEPIQPEPDIPSEKESESDTGNTSTPTGSPTDLHNTARQLLQSQTQNEQSLSSLLEQVLQQMESQNQLLLDFDKRLSDLGGQIQSLKNP